MDQAVARGAPQRRLVPVDEETAEVARLLALMGAIERDERLRERLRTADLDFRLADLWSGRVTGEPLRRALDALEALAAPATVAA